MVKAITQYYDRKLLIKKSNPTPAQKKYINALFDNNHHNALAAKQMGIREDSLKKQIKICRKRAEDNGYNPLNDLLEEVQKIEVPLKVLCFDIETSPNNIWSWGTIETNALKVITEKKIMSVGWRWLHEDKTYCKTLADFPKYNKKLSWADQSDKPLAELLRKLIHEADIVIAHNADYDVKMSRNRIIRHRLKVPSTVKTICTLKSIRKICKLESNKLDDAADYMGLQRKYSHSGIDMWFNAMNGDLQSWKEMKKYNIQDVDVLVDLYKLLLPYIDYHPDMSLNTNKSVCPKCGDEDLRKDGIYTTNSMSYKRYQCNNCGNWCSEKKGVNTTGKYKNAREQ